MAAQGGLVPRFVYACLLVLPLVTGNQVYTRAELREMLLVTLGNVDKETVDAPVTVDRGSIPTWLNGNFMRHSCGSFGESDFQNDSLPNYIEHLFDCIEIGSKFKILNGKATFTNRWYDTVTNDIYNYYDRNMNTSSVFKRTVYSKTNKAQLERWHVNMSDVTKVTEVPHVTWWKLGDEVVAMEEHPVGVVIDPETVRQQGRVQYSDDNIGYPASEGWRFTNNPAHEQMDADGVTLWSAVAVYRFTNRTTVDMRRVVYKVGPDKYRRAVGEYSYTEIDLTSCRGGPYPDFAARMGYLHSFCITENYIILPETAYMFNPCSMATFDRHEPALPQLYTFEKDAYSRLLVMRKSDGQFIADIETRPFFVTHQLGAYEAGDLIHADMVTYEDASVYDRDTYINELLQDHDYHTNVSRLTINTTDWTVTARDLRPAGGRAALEMPAINHAHNGRKYTYAYLAKNYLQINTNAITKLNVDTGAELDYVLEDGMFIQEPQFVATPTASAEDDGVVIAQGVDGRRRKAFMVFLDARTMTLLAHVTAPDLALMGLHEKFFPLPGGDDTSSSGPLTSHGAYEYVTLLSGCIVYIYSFTANFA